MDLPFFFAKTKSLRDIKVAQKTPTSNRIVFLLMLAVVLLYKIISSILLVKFISERFSIQHATAVAGGALDGGAPGGFSSVKHEWHG